MSGGAVLLWQEIPENLSAENKKIHLKTDENKTDWLSDCLVTGDWGEINLSKPFSHCLLSSPLLSPLSSLIFNSASVGPPSLAWPGLLRRAYHCLSQDDHTRPHHTTTNNIQLSQCHTGVFPYYPGSKHLHLQPMVALQCNTYLSYINYWLFLTENNLQNCHGQLWTNIWSSLPLFLSLSLSLSLSLWWAIMSSPALTGLTQFDWCGGLVPGYC